MHHPPVTPQHPRVRRVLVAPLDWGLGHATRCVPVIRELQRQGCEVLLAGSGDSLQLLKEEFPGLRAVSLPGYRPRYAHNDAMVKTMALQLPRFMRVISAEHTATNYIIEQAHIELVISDNRYGCWSRKIPSVIITHQSNILMPERFGWLQPVVRMLSDRMINRFHTCWIPDVPGERSLAGDLTSFGRTDVNIKAEYIGWLSRFEHQQSAVKKWDVLAVFSGPEPQRTILERIVVPQLQNSGLTYRVVRGLPALSSPPSDSRIVNFLPSGPLQAELAAADLVIARSGFSTVMDMQALGKKVVFVPTPGQTEQEHLARHLMKKGIAFYMEQNAFKLDEAIDQARGFSGFTPAPGNLMLEEAVARLLK